MYTYTIPIGQPLCTIQWEFQWTCPIKVERSLEKYHVILSKCSSGKPFMFLQESQLLNLNDKNQSGFYDGMVAKATTKCNLKFLREH
jgi:hypothetical protein